MNIKIFCVNEKGKIELTKCELEKLLAEAYEEGRHAGCNCKHNEEKSKIEPSVKPVEASKTPKVDKTVPNNPWNGLCNESDNDRLARIIDDIFHDLSGLDPILYTRSDVDRNKISDAFMSLGKEVAEL